MKARDGETAKKTLRVGQQVRFRLVNRLVDGVVVEDRGSLGVGGRRIWAIRFQFKYTEPSVVELPEEDILVDQ